MNAGVNLQPDTICMRYAGFCFLLLMFSSKTLVDQTGTGRLLWEAKEIKMTTVPQKKGVKFLERSHLKSLESQPNFSPPTTLAVFSLPASFYNQQLGWVCKTEWKMQQKTSLPLHLRLGSREQVDFLEGKNDHRSR